jgi:uncharacterized damage-inducible protein DinB
MNSLKLLERGNKNLIDSIVDLPANAWTDGIVTGSWTVRDIVDHLGISEELQKEAFEKFLDPKAKTPLSEEKAKAKKFNDEQWQMDKNQTWEQVLERYHTQYAKLKQLIEKIPADQLSKPETTTWYNDPSSLDDIIALNYGHKKHHIAQIKLFRQQNKI